MFAICAVAYIIAWAVMKALMPKANYRLVVKHVFVKSCSGRIFVYY